ncbi:MAG: hypothetical protein U0414_32805 [Polyangiaceae bacterium]
MTNDRSSVHRLSTLITLALGASLIGGCSSKDKGSEASTEAPASSGAPAADASKPEGSKDACKAPNTLKLQPKGGASGVCVALPDGFKAGNATLDQPFYGSQQILSDKGVYAGVLSFKRETLEKHAPLIEKMASDPDVEVVSRGEIPGRPFSNHVHTRSKSSGTEQVNAYLQFGSFVFFCSTTAAKGATASVDLCTTITSFGPSPIIATDDRAPSGDESAAAPTSAPEAAEPTGAAALEGDYTWFSSDGGGGSGRLKAKGDDFVINYSGSSGNGVVNCKPGKKEKTYNCGWSDPSGSGGVSFTVNAKGNLDGYWTGSGGGGGWTFNRAKPK